MNTTNIVDTMIDQHRLLHKDLGQVADELKNENPDANNIDSLLIKFAKDLEEHLKLENDTFYVELLKKMKDKGQATAKTEEFIGKMTEIGTAVMAFLEKYNKAKKIKQQMTNFRQEFSNIVETLNIRVEAEESGVYLYWSQY